MRRREFIALVLTLGLVLALGLVAAQAHAQTWPQRTVRVILPLPPGTATDIAARLFAQRLSERWGQPVIVENRQGGDGIPAVMSFLAARDNHTLMFSFAGVITINPLIHDKLPYDPARDLVPVASVVDNFFAIAASAALKVASLEDFVRLVRSQPGKLNWAATPGLPDYIFAALQRSEQGLDTTTPAGKAMFQMLGVFAEFERAMIAERVRAGLARAKGEGKRLGRPPIAPALEKRIREALATPGRPGIRVIAERFGVNPSTVQRISRPFEASVVADLGSSGKCYLEA